MGLDHHQVPSGYFIADSYLYLDLLLKKKLFKPVPPNTRTDMAGSEAVRGKKLLGALRFLWRSSPQGAHDARLVDLKQYIRSSPRRVPALCLQKSFSIFMTHEKIRHICSDKQWTINLSIKFMPYPLCLHSPEVGMAPSSDNEEEPVAPAKDDASASEAGAVLGQGGLYV